MRSLSPIIVLLLLAVHLVAQSPHGADLKMDCAACHNSKSWEIPASHWDFDAMSIPKSSKMTGMSLGIDTFHFNHNRTQFSLLGQHAAIDCRACHASLDFSEAQTDCISCHTDMHQQTLGTDCIRCHNSESWLVGNMADLHQENGFALVGAHVTASCYDCHTSASSLTFNRIGNDCINCHFDEFSATTNPNHQNAGFSTNCIECHDMNRFDWVTDNFNHDFFPLTKAHEIEDCAKCHTSGNYSNTSPECVSCHQMDFDASINPNHHNANIETNCILCHTTDPGWVPATFANHDDHYPLNGAHALIATDCATCHNGDYNNTPNTCFGCHAENFDQTTNPNHTTAQFPTDCIQCHTEDTWTPTSFDHDGQYFPIFSGAHQGEWDQCIDCHTNPATFKEVSCTTCHVNPQTDNDHNGVGGYAYNSDACLACHPSGSADEVFDHNATHFPLTGAHTTVACIECHANGYQGTPTDCASCHTQDFNQTANPNHTSLGFSTDCTSCHSTDPDWMPATFANHNEHYVLNGAHATIANDCVACHNGDYNNTPNTCFGCHTTDYTQTNNPNHTSAHFPTDCTQCHSEDTWTPASFDHDGQYFPIYSGAHNGEWDQCIDCHTNPANFAEVSCTTCHANPQTDNHHNGIGGYAYNSQACLACHPNGSANDNFDHNATNFPLTGAHTTVACIECHANGYQGTPTDCASCHTLDFNQTANPNHASLGFSTDCASCHSTDPDWMPATFANHNQHYALNGAHATIANDCVACHNGDYNNTPNTCFGCHATDYTQTNNPNHASASFPKDCAQCHSENAWEPANFDHDGQYFPIYRGKHKGEWDQCIECHTSPSDYSIFSCIDCHKHNNETKVRNDHSDVGGFEYSSTACLDCHPSGN